MTTYGTLVADPPWRYKRVTRAEAVKDMQANGISIVTRAEAVKDMQANGVSGDQSPEAMTSQIELGFEL